MGQFCIRVSLVIVEEIAAKTSFLAGSDFYYSHDEKQKFPMIAESRKQFIAPEQARNLGYSLRRYFVDQFHFENMRKLPDSAFVLDLGGNRIGKRGLFNIEQYPVSVIYANLSVQKRPHVQADACSLPFQANCFDAVICSELLEHISSPPAALAEIYRVLRPEGLVLVCVPFINRIHGDPYDYGRYTDFYWRELLEKLGFNDIYIEKQGLFWSVLADMLREWASIKVSTLQSEYLIKLISEFMGLTKRMALKWDSSAKTLNTTLAAFTTGFGIRASKR